MGKIVYRTLVKEDCDRIKELINRAFGFYQFVEDEKFLDEILNVYMQDCILASTYSRVAVKDNKVVGIILGSADKGKKISNLGNRISALGSMMKIAFSNKENKKAVKEFGKIHQAYEEIIKGKKKDFQGVIQLFIVSEECRGQGVGKALIKELSNYMKDMGVRSFYLYTDTRCNYGFYDSQNFNRLGEKEMNFEAVPASLTVFLYGYVV